MPNDRAWMLYGATGYTGKLIAQEAARRGLRPTLAGRNREAIEALAKELGCPAKVFVLDDSRQIAANLGGMQAVLNCAGPFSATAVPMMEGCLAAKVHYLDITGEIGVIEAAAARGEQAKAAGVSLFPAVGFDVVPSDCLAAMLAERLPGATHLQLAFELAGSLSPGTAKTSLEALPEGGRVRIDGVIQRVPIAWKTMEIPFHDRPRWAMTIPWGDVASAWYSTHIPNIEVYAAAKRQQITWAKRLRWLAPLLKIRLARKAAEKAIDRRITGPTEGERHRIRSSFWGRVSNELHSVSATMQTASGYHLTVITALGSLEKVLDGDAPVGFATPSMAFGKQFILSFPDVAMQWGEER